ncbi:MAG: site-specific integrase [Prevotella sp.]|nr:site-specific integrase [Prevotella sp.]
MALKRNYRCDNTYMISTDTGDNPKLGAKMLSDGRESLFLDYYFGYTKTINEQTGKEGVKVDRRREFLKLYLWTAPRTPFERQHNKETMELARRVRYERGQELLDDVHGYRLRKNDDINFIDYFQAYLDSYTKKDVRMVALALRRFIEFLNDTPEYKQFAKAIKPNQINKDMMEAFVEYLQSRSKGTGAKSIYARFKKVILYAVEHDVFAKNPCAHITIKVDDNILVKDVLSQDEIKQLLATPYEGNPAVQRAFVFCLHTGLRFCDVKDLTFANVDYSNGFLKFEQNKTKGHSAASGVAIPLNAGLLQLIGEPKAAGELIFALPSYEHCMKLIKQWVRRAGITKHISWHCARHSFATNALINGANIKTVATLLGHSTLKYTEKYTRATDTAKREAINSLLDLTQYLPELNS